MSMLAVATEYPGPPSHVSSSFVGGGGVGCAAPRLSHAVHTFACFAAFFTSRASYAATASGIEA